MDFSKELLFFFSLLGVFNGLIVAAYFFFFINENKFSNKFLGALLLVLCIRIGKSVLLFFDKNILITIVLIGVMACSLIGPLLFLYIKTNTGKIKKLQWKHTLHLIPAIVLSLYFLSSREDYQNNRILISKLINIINFQWFCYLVISGFLLKNTFDNFRNRVHKNSKNEVWSVSIYVGIFLIWFSYVSFKFTSYIAGAVVFSFIFYILMLILYNLKKERRQKKHPTSDTKQVNEIIQKLKYFLEEEKVFKNNNLKMPELAKLLNITPHQFSEILNLSLNKNFSNYINEYRINEAKHFLLHDTNYTVEHIGELSGFKSTSAFYTAFKKHTGVTPSAFKSQS
ncbi:AraC family transcriptional regulator [Aquimarina sp. MAR_2010_214]|uniref:helix-turn-helix domain-containing protein n=1 Tax=Aquimarina sp. MAR_2010_214 TaxID=1250026 RepID=UPI000C70FE44|nr:helix-turn-helix domain-containing protein [Aquimarina sp. MAR_2010_214]